MGRHLGKSGKAPFADTLSLPFSALSHGRFGSAFAPDVLDEAPAPVFTTPALGYAKLYDAFVVGDLGTSPALNTVLLVTADDVPNTIDTTRTVTVNAPAIVSTIDTLGDQDFFRVDLVGGHMYDIGEYLKAGGPSGVPLSDAYLQLYGPDGKLLVEADGGGPNTPQGLDALLTYTPEVSGTYYINARAFDQNSANGTGGDSVGDYELFVNDVTGRVDTSYKPYYDTDSPLHSIDWGTQVDRSSRNPDGAEGPRVTGNPYSGTSNIFGIEGKNVITVYFAKAGDVFVAEDPTNPGLTTTMIARGIQGWEKTAMFEAFDLYQQVADVVFVEVSTRQEADFKIVTYNGTPGAGASLLGRMSAPNTDNEGQAEFNAGDVRWTQEGLQKGGFYFPTLVHEFGHGMGMAHPHDNGGHSSVMRGAGTGTTDVIGGGYGDFDLSQQVFTVMSYNDGWATSPYGQPRSGGLTGTEVDHYGWVASLSPLDIAVIQDKYGVNEEWHTGDDVYELKDVNGPGTYYESIWDAGGTDEIRYGGARDALIDLRPATLQYEEGGGGRVSYAWGIYGGFTVANGVTIENATTGSGKDQLTGNDAANRLDGGAGDDTLFGLGGNDVLIGGAGADTLTGGDGADTFRFAAGDSGVGAGRDTIADFHKGEDKIDLAGASTFIGSSAFSGSAGEVRYAASSGQTVVELDSNGDGLADLQILLSGELQLSYSDFIDVRATATQGSDLLTGTAGNDTIRGLGGDDILFGLAGSDTLDGGSGDDILVGGGGRDLLTGGSGADVFRLESAGDSVGAGRDRILDFQSGVDKIDLTAFGHLDFIGKRGFSGNEGELHYVKYGLGFIVEGDLNGDKIADFQIELPSPAPPLVTDFLVG
jgi:serralysin